MKQKVINRGLCTSHFTKKIMTNKMEIMDSTASLVVSKPSYSYFGGPPRIQKCGSRSHILHIFCLFFAIFITSSSGMKKIFGGKYNTINVLKSANESWEMNDNISVGSEKIDFFGCWGRCPPATTLHWIFSKK